MDKEEITSICPHCKNLIDETTCWCGDYIRKNSYHENHNPIPMGCTCGFYTEKEQQYIQQELKLKYGS